MFTGIIEAVGVVAAAEEVFDGLCRTAGEGDVSRYVAELLRRHVIDADLANLIGAEQATKVPKREFHINTKVAVTSFADLGKRYYEEKHSFLRRVGNLADPAQQAAAASLFD